MNYSRRRGWRVEEKCKAKSEVDRVAVTLGRPPTLIDKDLMARSTAGRGNKEEQIDLSKSVSSC
ncbi:hypothetical protein J6590_016296 [Homalodisca vitripennis]|nr:hypothetical protein J6590_016296 [Homalodisca vitripennis]